MIIHLLGVLIIPIAIIILIVLKSAMGKSIQYQCENCGQLFHIPPIDGIVAPHSMGRKYVKCPNCGMATWASPVCKNR